jgi:hypothetical protein
MEWKRNRYAKLLIRSAIFIAKGVKREMQENQIENRIKSLAIKYFSKIYDELNIFSSMSVLVTPICIFSIYFLITCINYNFYLTNEFTPGGDGFRIFRYLKYMEKVPEIFPFWQGHYYHGYPLLADPENHMLLGLILDTESPYFNLHLNLIFLFLTAGTSFVFRCIARVLGMSQIASFSVGVALILCVPMVRLFMHGTISVALNSILIYISIAVLLKYFNSHKNKHVYILLLIPLIMAPAIQTGYYLPILFHLPAFVLLMCIYLKNNETFKDSLKKISVILVLISFLMVLFSMPLLLPILDGIMLSKTFETQTPTIIISQQDIYNFYLGLWPIILLSLLYSRGLLRRYALLFFVLSSINFILIFFKIVGLNTFFELWATMPVLKNIRWQHPIRELSSISAAFCVGILIDACREKLETSSWVHYLSTILIVLILSCLTYFQFVKHQPIYMVTISIIFVAMAIVGRRLYVMILCTTIIFVLLSANFTGSPFGNKIYKSTNNIQFVEYKSEYCWWRATGWDKFTPVFGQGAFSMVFLHEYRLFVELLYGQEIKAQRPHWMGKVDGIQEKNKNPKIAQLMAIHKPQNKSDVYDPFRVYDRWVVANEANAIKIMQNDKFSLEDPIILSEIPDIQYDPKKKLSAKARLIGKTAETISLHVRTNKNSVVFIPEIFHKSWQATLNGKRVKIIKAYGSMRAVAIPPGEHKLVMRFVYKAFYLGIMIASISFMLSLILVYLFKNNLYRLLPAAMNNSIELQSNTASYNIAGT